MSKANNIAIEMSRRLGMIKVADGFETDIGTRTFRGRLKLEPDSVPFSTLIEGDDNRRDDVTGAAAVDQHYTIEAHCECDPDNPNDAAHKMLADMKKVIFSKDQPKNLGGLVRRVRYDGRRILPREDGLKVVAAQIHIIVEYVEDLGEP